MKSNEKRKIIILLTVGFVFTFSAISICNLNFTAGFMRKNLKSSAVLSGKIHIDGNSGWIAFRADNNCTGSGTYSDPYLIKDLEIDGGGSGSCITIEYSTVFFIIENCILYNSGEDWDGAGIFLRDVDNGMLVNNICSNNSQGISIGQNSTNNVFSDNTFNDNRLNGIVYGYSSNNLISGNIFNNNGQGIFLIGCSTINISGNICSFNQIGLSLDSNSEDNFIHGNVFNNNAEYGINLYNSSNNYIEENTVNFNGNMGINFDPDSSYNEIVGNTVCFNGWLGIHLNSDSTNNLIKSNNCSYNWEGISVRTLNNIISENYVEYNSGPGIHLWGGDTGNKTQSNIITGNFINHNNDGINFDAESTLNVIEGNDISNNNYDGIVLHRSDYNSISGNNIIDNNMDGISLAESDNNIVSGNNAINNSNGIILGSSDENTIEGNIINKNWQGIYIVECYASKISENIINENNMAGIHVDYSDGNLISRNTVDFNTIFGIWLVGSTNNDIVGNNIRSNSANGIRLDINYNEDPKNNTNNYIGGNNVINSEVGIYLGESHNTIVTGNDISNTNYGILLEGSHFNSISGNDVSNNNHGILLVSSSQYNIISENVILENLVVNAFDVGTNNQWDNGVMGNYWSDYSGEDANDDGIGDTPYFIPGLAISQDNLPMWWDPPKIIASVWIDNKKVPSYSLSIEGIPQTMWYTIEGVIGIFPITELEGNIDQDAWNDLTEGEITITFYAQDSKGEIGTASVTNTEIIPSKSKYWILSPVVIDDWDLGDFTWEEAAAQPWCKGSGTLEDPYVIKNVIINGESFSSCMTIQNSYVHFRIEDSIFYNSNQPLGTGLLLINAFNGIVTKNQFLNNGMLLPTEPTGAGISLIDSANNIIKKNTARGNVAVGIYLANSDNNILVNNYCTENMFGIILRDTGTGGSDDNVISNNDCNRNYDMGILVWINSNNNLIEKNDCTENTASGIVVSASNGNVIAHNYCSENGVTGITVYSSNDDNSQNNILYGNTVEYNAIGIYFFNVDNNDVFRNDIKENTDGIFLDGNCENNLIYQNNIIGNDVQASDTQYWMNNWYHPIILEGNYWSDYTGTDSDGDGIGETPWPWAGFDEYPIMEKGGWEYRTPIEEEILNVFFYPDFNRLGGNRTVHANKTSYLILGLGQLLSERIQDIWNPPYTLQAWFLGVEVKFQGNLWYFEEESGWEEPIWVNLYYLIIPPDALTEAGFILGEMNEFQWEISFYSSGEQQYMYFTSYFYLI